MNARELWSKRLLLVGYIAMLVGALDPMEGSLVILPGSALLALGTSLSRGERPLMVYRWWGFVLIAFGVGALFGMSAIGGLGGTSGHSRWWSVLVLPYLIGWAMAICGPGNPRWVQRAGIMVGLWYLAIPAMVLARSNASRPASSVALIAVGALGLAVIGGCLWRLRHPAAQLR